MLRIRLTSNGAQTSWKTSMDKLEFEQPVDFLEGDEVQAMPELRPFKASSILYSLTGVVLTLSFLIVMVDLASRQGTSPDTMIEMLEWNNFSQLGVIGGLNSVLFFWLGLMSDRRGA